MNASAPDSGYQPPDLRGKVALVAGATRGVGRGTALALAEAGAIVYCTGRSTRANRVKRGARKKKISPFDHARRPETVEETAEMATARGGQGIAAILDHTDPKLVKKLLARIQKEQGKLNILVNDISEIIPQDFGKAFWELNLENGFANLRNVLHSHITASHFATPLLIETARKSGRTGLIVEIGDGDSYTYRGHLFYDLIKTSAIRLAFAMGRELRRKNVAAIALTPGFLRSEAMLEHFGVTEANWLEAARKDPNYAESETPLYAGRAIAALAGDPSSLMKKSGRVFSSWGLSDEYGFSDADGRRPHWGRHATAKYGDMKPCGDAFYEHWTGGSMEALFPDWP